MHQTSLKLDCRYATRVSLWVGSRFWHNEAIPGLIPLVSQPRSNPIFVVLPSYSISLPSAKWLRGCLSRQKFLEFALSCCYCSHDANRYKTYATYQYTLLLSVPYRSTVTNLSCGLLQGKWQVTFLLRFLLIASVAHVTSILCYHRVGLDLLFLSELYTIVLQLLPFKNKKKKKIGKIGELNFFLVTFIITRLVCHLIQIWKHKYNKKF